MTAPGVLIVEADARRLRAEGHLRVVDAFEAQLEAAAQAGHLRLHRHAISSAADLESARFLANLARFDAVVIVAHASPAGLQAAPRVTLDWRSCAAALAPVRPRILLAIACCGGSGPACRALFDGIPTLELVLGSPTTLTVRQARMAFLEMMATVGGGAWSEELSAFMTIFNGVVTGGVMVRRTREEIDAATDGELLVKDLLGVVAGSVANAAFGPAIQRRPPPSAPVHRRRAPATPRRRREGT